MRGYGIRAGEGYDEIRDTLLKNLIALVFDILALGVCENCLRRVCPKKKDILLKGKSRD